MNTITIQFCDEDRKRIDELIAFAGLLVGEIRSHKDAIKFGAVPAIAEKAAPQVAETNTAADENPAVAPIIEEPIPVEPVAEPAPEVKPVSLAEFQKTVTLVVSKGTEAKQAVKSIINKYAPSVSEVPEDKRAEVIAELSKI